ncbi:hypothetical protein [Exiguobacterium sp. s193]|uniref:hypothetical protein n=1 Tax=Exiguobacterium sp. s193 TaxID=2751207 RepID=UPI001BEB618D|nr:hypothetical protein [Exiguobacterium sp. s193]
MAEQEQLTQEQLDNLLKNSFAMQVPILEKFMKDTHDRYALATTSFKRDMEAMKESEWHQFFAGKLLPHFFLEHLGFGASFRFNGHDKEVDLPDNVVPVRNDADDQIAKVVLGVEKAMKDMHIKNHSLVAKFYQETLELACQMGSRVGMSDEFYTLVKPSLAHENETK